MDMKEMGVTEWRSSLGSLRRGGEVVAISYRRHPAALMVPLSPNLWEDATTFVEQLVQLRDEKLRGVHNQWIARSREPVRINVEEAHRSSAMLFGHIANNAPVILTFYAYDNAIMLPVPPDLSRADLETLYTEIHELVQE